MNREDIVSALDKTDLIKIVDSDVVKDSVDAVCRWVLSECNFWVNKKVLLVPILDGALPLFNSICRTLDVNGVCYDYQSVLVNSYIDCERNEVRFLKLLEGCWEKYLTIIVDDVYDTGNCIKSLVENIVANKSLEIGLSNIRYTVLISKRSKLSRLNVCGGRVRSYAPLYYPGCENGFIVGCGMDCNYYFRGTNMMLIYEANQLIANLRMS